MKQITREEFDGTFFDVSEWTDEQKTKFQERCFELGYRWYSFAARVQELQASRYYLKADHITYADSQYESSNFKVQKYYSDMFPEETQAPAPKLDVISEIVKLVQESKEVSVSEEDERGFDGLVYTEIEKDKPESQYYCLDLNKCSEEQKNYIIDTLKPDRVGMYGIQICNDGESWFQNELGIDADDIEVTFNDLFKYKEGM